MRLVEEFERIFGRICNILIPCLKQRNKVYADHGTGHMVQTFMKIVLTHIYLIDTYRFILKSHLF